MRYYAVYASGSEAAESVQLSEADANAWMEKQKGKTGRALTVKGIDVSDEELHEQLTEYKDLAPPLFDQIFALHNYVTTVANFFVVITGAIWAIAASDKLAIGRAPAVALLLLHLVGTFWMWALLYGAFGSIRARFEMVDSIGLRTYPAVLAIGRGSFKRKLDLPWASWGKQRRDFFWYTLPAGGCAGSVFLIWYVLH